MIVTLPPDLITKFEKALSRAGTREIGGVLVGEHVADEEFRVVDLSVQRSGGTESCFVRHPKKHRRFMRSFFRRTGADYARFNYLGEWHSHPLYLPVPSTTDLAQMQLIVEDGSDAPLFAVLLIIRLDGGERIELGATAFTPGSAPTRVEIRVQPRPADDPTLSGKPTLWSWKRSGWWRRKDINGRND
ncbi:Mov34/MPN/PAD-1 family protein [Sphingobium yanoikuyae]|uniref:Mov34/MPN/PAD-1 family protein n=1 Tax=Sphingobium yanoikuyae TaxID=13690 RepID=UPI00242CA75E|nr:Mov34/MPN/PAD-1 family protein [Sphingobium yanoikuyae]